MTLNQRSIIVCDPRLQYHSLMLPLAVAITTAVTLCALCVLLVGGIEEFIGDEEALKDAIARAQMHIALVVAAVVLVHIVLVVWLGLITSHRIAGPIYRIRKSLEEVAKGNMNVRIHLRKHDKLVEVADAFNAMMESLAAKAAPDKPEEVAAKDNNLPLAGMGTECSSL